MVKVYQTSDGYMRVWPNGDVEHFDEYLEKTTRITSREADHRDQFSGRYEQNRILNKMLDQLKTLETEASGLVDAKGPILSLSDARSMESRIKGLKGDVDRALHPGGR